MAAIEELKRELKLLGAWRLLEERGSDTHLGHVEEENEAFFQEVETILSELYKSFDHMRWVDSLAYLCKVAQSITL